MVLISLHVSSTVLVLPRLDCLHFSCISVSYCHLIMLSSSFSTSNLFSVFSLVIVLSFILIPASISLWSEATSGLENARHIVTLVLHLLLTSMKSFIFLVFPSGDSHVHFLLAFLW